MDICTQTETQKDIFKRHEQEVFAQSVIEYCTYFRIFPKNKYNINFPHLQDFDGILNTEKYLNQSLDPSLSVNEREFALSSEFARALEDILIAKNVK